MADWAATLGFGWLGTLAGASLLWLWSLRRNDVSVVDIAWGLSFVALTAFYRVRGPGPTAFHALHLALVGAWGLRLALHIARRNRGQGEDRRYAAMRAEHASAFRLRSLVTVFALQATLATLLSAPLLAVQSASAVNRGGFALGCLLWAAGFAWEAVADEQLRRFRADERRQAVLDRGLWRYSRHPNYFGEAVLWWGYGAMAAATGAWWTLAAPVLMTWLLLRVSGVALLEKTIVDRRPEYADYIARTSAFVPLPPRCAAPRPGRAR